MTLRERTLLMHKQKAEEARIKKIKIGKLSNSVLNQIEFLSLNGHDREKLQKVYSIKQIFYYSNLVRRQKNLQTKEQMIALRTTIQSAQVGDSKVFKQLLQELDK